MAISKSWCGNKDNRWKLAPSLDLEAETKLMCLKQLAKISSKVVMASINYLQGKFNLPNNILIE
jgi:hypothetical protein